MALNWWHSRLWFPRSSWKDSPVVPQIPLLLLGSLLCCFHSPFGLLESSFLHVSHGHDNITSSVGSWEEVEGERRSSPASVHLDGSRLYYC